MQPVTQDRRWAGQDGSAPSQGHAPASGKGGSWSGQGLPAISSKESGFFPENLRTPYLGPGNHEETLPRPSQPLWTREVLAPWSEKRSLFAFCAPVYGSVFWGPIRVSADVRRYRVLAFHNGPRCKAHSCS